LRLWVGNLTSSGYLKLNSNRQIVLDGSSSLRYKENITEFFDAELQPEKLYELNVKQFNYKPEYSFKSTI
jgi:hypothetical protein